MRIRHPSHWNFSCSFLNSLAAITHASIPHALVYALFAHGCSAQGLSQRPLQLRRCKPHQLVRNEQVPYEAIQAHEGREGTLAIRVGLLCSSGAGADDTALRWRRAERCKGCCSTRAKQTWMEKIIFCQNNCENVLSCS